MAVEVRNGGAIRLAGRELSGVAMPYGTVAPNYRERFEPGAFGSAGPVPLLLQHDPGSVVLEASQVRLQDGPDALRLSGDLEESSAAFQLVQRRSLRGLSVGFAAVRESRDGEIRVIERAELHEVSLVDSPAYPEAVVEVRAAVGKLAARVPYGEKLSCRCKSGCTHARFERGSLKAAAESADEILAIRGSYADTLASKKARTLRLTETSEGLSIELDLPDTSAGRDLAEQSAAARLLARPVWDETASQYEVADGVAVISGATVKAVLIGATDADEGWPSVEFTPAKRQRRRWYA